jgi:hypothetical protein
LKFGVFTLLQMMISKFYFSSFRSLWPCLQVFTWVPRKLKIFIWFSSILAIKRILMRTLTDLLLNNIPFWPSVALFNTVFIYYFRIFLCFDKLRCNPNWIANNELFVHFMPSLRDTQLWTVHLHPFHQVVFLVILSFQQRDKANYSFLTMTFEHFHLWNRAVVSRWNNLQSAVIVIVRGV